MVVNEPESIVWTGLRYKQDSASKRRNHGQNFKPKIKVIELFIKLGLAHKVKRIDAKL